MSLQDNKNSSTHKIPCAKKKKMFVYVATFVAVFVMFSVVSALFQAHASVTNTFKAESFEVTLSETFTPPEIWETNNPVTKEIQYQNTGTTPALLRVQMSESWVDVNGMGLSNEIEEAGAMKNVVSKKWSTPDGLGTASWVAKDGWYYYTKVLQPKGKEGDSVKILDSVALETFNDDTLRDPYVGAQYNLNFLHEYVKKGDVETLWKATPSIDASGTIVWTFI